MTTLKAEQRPDRNGKMVTRWVKDTENTPSSALPSVPPVTRTEPRATKATRDDLEGYLDNCRISFEHPYADILRRDIRMMSNSTAETMVFHLWEGTFGNDYAVGHALAEIYGRGSSVPEGHRDTVFKNLMSIIPDYGMNHDSENEDILRFTKLVFDAVDGMQTYAPYTAEDITTYQSAACITNHIFRTIAESPEDTEAAGFSGKRHARLDLGSLDSISLLREHIAQIDRIREVLMERRSLHPDVIRAVAEAGVLRDGAL